MITTLQKSKGFTLIEAIVSLALFAIAFSGLYFFFGMAQQANNNSEKRMHLNLMANHILETIHAEAFRDDADVANPFVTPASYTANLSDCSIYTAPDVRHTWCTELNASVGPHKGVHADEIRTVEVVKDEAYLIANVSLVVDAGIGDKNLIKTFLSRKIAAPRRTTPYAQCVENHNKIVRFIKKEMKACHSGKVDRITYSCPDCNPIDVSYNNKASPFTHMATHGLKCPEFFGSSAGSGYPESGAPIYDTSSRNEAAYFPYWIQNTFKNVYDPEITYWGGSGAGNISFIQDYVNSSFADPTHRNYRPGYNPSKKHHVFSCCYDEILDDYTTSTCDMKGWPWLSDSFNAGD